MLSPLYVLMWFISENPAPASCPLHANAGQGGQRVQLEWALNLICPDLNSDHEQGAHRGNGSFPQQASANKFAPRLTKWRGQASRKASVCWNFLFINIDLPNTYLCVILKGTMENWKQGDTDSTSYYSWSTTSWTCCTVTSTGCPRFPVWVFCI